MEDLQRHACVYVTQLESLQDVGEQFYPGNDPRAIAEYVKVMRTINEFNQWWNPAYLQTSDFPMLPYQCVFLPTVEDIITYSQIRDYPNLIDLWVMDKENWLRSIRGPNQEDFYSRRVWLL